MFYLFVDFTFTQQEKVYINKDTCTLHVVPLTFVYLLRQNQDQSNNTGGFYRSCFMDSKGFFFFVGATSIKHLSFVIVCITSLCKIQRINQNSLKVLLK